MSENIQEIQKQTFRYYYEDGLVEMAVGLLFFVIGLDTWLISITPQGSPLSIMAWILLPILTVGGIFGVGRYVKNLKEKFVHPRTGYIMYAAKPNRYRWLVIGFSLALAVSVLVLPYDWLQKGSITGGTILFVIMASIGAQVGLKRMIAAGALGMAFGVLFGYLPTTDPSSLAATFVATGIVIALIGAYAWRSYLASNPLPEPGTGGDQ
jgi:hypothetical protein